jgi:hypothetical protein
MSVWSVMLRDSRVLIRESQELFGVFSVRS